MRRVIQYSAFILMTYILFRLLLTTQFQELLILPSSVVGALSFVQVTMLGVKPFVGSMEDLWIFGVFFLALGTLEQYLPADNSNAVPVNGSDLPYSILAKIGAFWLLMTLTSHPVVNQLQAYLKEQGIPFFSLRVQLESLGIPLVFSAVIQWFIFDGFDTVRHRIEHYFGGLWAFHSVHHSQTKMTVLTFDRNHVVSLFYNSIFYACLSRFLGIQIGTLVTIYFAFNFIEYLTHSNVNISYGKILDKVIVCPLYHRTHHSSAKITARYGTNFANIFPIWDIVMGTADFSYKTKKTGIYGEDEAELGRNLFENQYSGFRKFFKLAKSTLSRRN